jgi:hypothetical protein
MFVNNAYGLTKSPSSIQIVHISKARIVKTETRVPIVTQSKYRTLLFLLTLSKLLIACNQRKWRLSIYIYIL